LKIKLIIQREILFIIEELKVLLPST